MHAYAILSRGCDGDDDAGLRGDDEGLARAWVASCQESSAAILAVFHADGFRVKRFALEVGCGRVKLQHRCNWLDPLTASTESLACTLEGIVGGGGS